MAAPNWIPELGKTLLIQSGPNAGQKHLHVIVYGPRGIPEYGTLDHLVLVSVTSTHHGVPYDKACEFVKGEHRFIEHDSHAYYRQMRVEKVTHAVKMVSDGTWVPHDDFSATLLQRTIDGVGRSIFVKREFRRIMGL